MRKAQKSLSRKKKGSKNREKARIKVARIHARITDSRKDHLHKLTTQLVRENQTIVVENLAVKNIVKNPKLSQAISELVGDKSLDNYPINAVGMGEITSK
ncbi:mobile element protein [Microcystis sp. 0824]|nr:mobile element protein [Microcystis sp. 0824]